MGATNASEGVPLATLRWRCRRGTRELDLLLTRCLDNHVAHGGQAQRCAFARLLAAEDDRLWDWICGRDLPTDPAEYALIQSLRAASGPATSDARGNE